MPSYETRRDNCTVASEKCNPSYVCRPCDTQGQGLGWKNTGKREVGVKVETSKPPVILFKAATIESLYYTFSHFEVSLQCKQIKLFINNELQRADPIEDNILRQNTSNIWRRLQAWKSIWLKKVDPSRLLKEFFFSRYFNWMKKFGFFEVWMMDRKNEIFKILSATVTSVT